MLFMLFAVSVPPIDNNASAGYDGDTQECTESRS